MTKKPARMHYYVRQNRSRGVRTGWHSQASFQKFLQTHPNWQARRRGHIVRYVIRALAGCTRRIPAVAHVSQVSPVGATPRPLLTISIYQAHTNEELN